MQSIPFHGELERLSTRHESNQNAFEMRLIEHGSRVIMFALSFALKCNVRYVLRWYELEPMRWNNESVVLSPPLQGVNRASLTISAFDQSI